MVTGKRKHNIDKTRVRFHGGVAARRDMLAVLATPVVIDGTDEEHTRFLMTTGRKWSQKPIDADVVGVVHEPGPAVRGWRLLGKRGDVYLVQSDGIQVEQIPDAGTGPGKFGHLASLRRIGEVLYACGYSRQVYERTPGGWAHRDRGLLLHGDPAGRGLNDIAGDGHGELCAVGAKGEIAFDAGGGWKLLERITDEHLYAVCRDGEGRYCAAGGGGTVLRGSASGFESLCRDDNVGTLWAITWHDGALVVAAGKGLYQLREGALVPFGPPLAPVHVGYKLTAADGVLWSIGTDQIWCLADNTWTEWECPDNAR